ncbi:MAG: hypothetical protein K6G16_10285 [Lachnospiraceae bacterium]|nr:hypothetical protein [Lachnospiraceae bacterium]
MSSSLSDDLASLDKEIEDLGHALEEEMPKGSVLLTMIFWNIYQEMLTQRGLIAPGNYAPYEDVEDLIRRCNAQNEERAQEQLRRGDSTIRREGSACMAVEVYLDAICVIYPDGSVKVLRNDPELAM